MTPPTQAIPTPAGTEPAARVLLVTSDASTSTRLQRLLAAHRRAVALVGAVGDARAALRTARAGVADVLLVDTALADADVIEVTGRLRRAAPHVPVLLFSRDADEDRVFAALRAGAAGCVSARLGIGRIVEAIADARRGGVVLEPVLSRRFWQRLAAARPDPESLPALSPEELELLAVLARGLTNAEAGRALRLKRRTVRTRLARLYRRLGVHSHAEAVAKALRAGLIEL